MRSRLRGTARKPRIAGTGPKRLAASIRVLASREETVDFSDSTRDMHRAIQSLMEELEADDWYNQRADACKDADLEAILVHNRDEEKEHAAMILEWIRRKDSTFSRELKDYLFTEKPIATLEAEHKG